MKDNNANEMQATMTVCNGPLEPIASCIVAMQWKDMTADVRNSRHCAGVAQEQEREQPEPSHVQKVVKL
jgi:hypothetical protein